MPTIQPFQINIPDADLGDLRRRLKQTRWPETLADMGWDYGVDQDYVRALCDYWADGFDWRRQEAGLNRWHHYRAEIGGFGLHFIREGEGKKKPALMLLHGWPSSFWQMTRLLPLLTDTFEVIVPSLPGYGFSDRPRKTGMNVTCIAELFDQLMKALGHRRYGIRAGDMGAAIAREIAYAQPEKVAWLHVTGLFPTTLTPPKDATPAEQAYLTRVKEWSQKEGGYAIEQATKPQTLGIGLNDSPAGLAAWIVEKFRSWTDCGGMVERSVPRDELLTNLMIYWVTQTIASSMRLYRESLSAPMPSTGKRLDVPTAFAQMPKDLTPGGPREFGERGYRVERWTEMPRGGHFAEWEEPELIAEDIKAFVRHLGAPQRIRQPSL